MNSRLEDVLAALCAEIATDTELNTAALLGGAHVYLRMSSEALEQIPGVYYIVMDQAAEECWEPVFIRWEIWAPTYLKVLRIQKRLIQLMHNEQKVELAGAVCTLQMDAAYDAPDSTRPDYFRRILETRIQIVRLRATA